MDIKQAYDILELPFGATKEEIDKQFKKLSLKAHPDRGGTNEDFVDLSKAKELALVYADNKAVIVVANHIVNQELTAIQRKNEINEEVKSIINKKDRQVRGKYQSMKDMTLVTAAISGGFALLTNKSMPFFNTLPEDSTLKQMMLMLSLIFGAFYLFINFLTNRLKDRIDELKELFENKEEMFEILLEVFGEKSDKDLRREEIYLLIKEKYRTINSGETTIRPSDILLSSSTSIRALVRFIGHKDFGKILLLKGVSNKLLEEIEFKENGKYEVKFKLKK